MKNITRILAICAVVAILFTPRTASAQACSVTISLTASLTDSADCFVANGNSVRFSITGTWVGTASLRMSRDGGASYTVVDTFTSNTAGTTPARTANVRYDVQFTSRTSGTLTGTIQDLTYSNARLAYSSVNIGSVAYASFGTSMVSAGSTSLYVADVYVPVPFTATGIAVLNGATAGSADTRIVALYDAAGQLVTTSSLSGAAITGTSAFQKTAFITPVTIAAGRYWCGVQHSGTTDTLKTVAASTAIDVMGAVLTGAAYGTASTTIVPPTTFTADRAPICYIY